MRLIVGEASLDDFDLAALVAEIKRILNNRPLTDVSSDPKDFSALTPHMLLTGALDDATGPDLFMKIDQYRKSWRQNTSTCRQVLWKRWLSAKAQTGGGAEGAQVPH